MDGRRRLAEPLTWIAPWLVSWRARLPAFGAAAKPARDHRRDVRRPRRLPTDAELQQWRLTRLLRRSIRTMLKARPPRGFGISAAALIIFASLAYGAVRGDHVPAVVDALKDVRDSVGNAAGFRIVSLALTGH